MDTASTTWVEQRTDGPFGFGERRLMAAVLEDALSLVRRGRRGSPAQRAAYDDAKRWIEMDDELWPFSFVRLCDALGLDPDGVRRRMRRPSVAIHVAPAEMALPMRRRA